MGGEIGEGEAEGGGGGVRGFVFGGRGEGEDDVAGGVVAAVGDAEGFAVGGDFNGEVAPEAGDFPAGEFDFVVGGEDAEVRAAVVNGGVVVGEVEDGAADGAVLHELGPAVADAPGVEFFKGGVVGAATVGFGEVDVGAKLGVDKGAALGPGAVGGEAALPAHEVVQGVFVAVAGEVGVVHVDVEAVGGEVGEVLVGVAEGEHGAEGFEDVAGGGEHLADAAEVGGEGFDAGGERVGLAVVGAFVAELEDEGVGAGNGGGGLDGDFVEEFLGFFREGGGGGAVEGDFGGGVDGVEGDDAHEAVAFAVGDGVVAAQGVDAEGAEVIGDGGDVGGADNDAF